MKTLLIILFLSISIGTTPDLSQARSLLLDDFESVISVGPEGSIDATSNGGSSVKVEAATDIKYSGKQSLKITYEAVPTNSSYLLINRSSDYWLVKPEDIAWEEYNAIAFYMYGSDSKMNISFDIIDNGFEIWHCIFKDDFIGWKQVVCPFSEFHPRSDWQPENSDKNSKLDYPIRSFQIEPLVEGKIKKGTLYFNKVELISNGTVRGGTTKNLLLDDFEGEISGGPKGSIDIKSNGGSSVKVEAATDIKYSGKQSLKITYEAVPTNSSYLLINRSSDYWLVKPEDIAWEEYNAIAFYMYGSDSKMNIYFYIVDSGFEWWSFIFTDNFTGWKQVVCPFSEFHPRSDWQPENSDKNSKLDYPIRNLQIEIKTTGKTKEGILYFDKVELINN